MTEWQSFETAPKDRQILARRHNDVMFEYYVVWWNGDEPYPWASEHTAYPTDRLDDWCEIPGERDDSRSEIDRLREALKLMTEWASNVVESNKDSAEIERCRALANGQGVKVS